jgi:predicted dehydrogenase
MHLLERVRLRPVFCAPAAFDPDPDRAAAVAHLADWAGDDWSKFLAIPSDVVAVCGPVASRYAAAAQLLHAGRHVVVPPPVCATRAVAESLWRTAAAGGSRLGVLRLDGDRDFFRALAEARSGRLGPVRTVRRFVASVGLPSAEPTGDVFDEFGPADLSQLIDLVADEPVHVDARPTPRIDREDEMGGYVLTVGFRGGAVASIGRSISSVTPEDGSWTVSGRDGGYARGVRWQRGEDDEIFPLAESAVPDMDPLARLAAVVHRNGDELRDEWQRAAWTVALLNAARRSLASGHRSPVTP